LVHANSLSISRLLGPVAAELGIASLGHIRDIVGISRAAVADVNRNTRLLAVSAATQWFYLQAGVDPSRVFVCHNGVDLQQFRPREPTGYLHRELGLPPRALLVAAVGQIGMRKGLHHLLRAAETVCARLPTVHFIVFGRRYSQKAEAVQYEQDLVRASSTGVLAGRVLWAGVRPDIDRVLNEVSVLAHAARQEPLGRVLLEAAASGVPVVATDVGGTAEIFPDHRSGAVLVAPDDPGAFADALLQVLGDRAVREDLSLAGRRRAVEAFDARQAAAQLAAHYRAAGASDASTRA
jgi:glycosyltransferase involved in cell wall biosynthesis